MAEERGARILVVDDNVDVRESTAEILELEGYQVSQAADQDDAARQIGLSTFDLVVLDLGLDRAGLALLDRVASLPTVLAVSGQGDRPGDPRIASFLSKPFSPLHLLETIAGCLAR